MVMTGVHTIDSSLNKTKEWLKDVQEACGFEEQEDAYVALRAVLMTLRDRLPLGECTDFAAQLPLFLAGVYYHEWKPSGKPLKLRHKDEFIAAVRENIPERMDAERIARAVFAALEKRITSGEMNDVKSNLPEEIQSLF